MKLILEAIKALFRRLERKFDGITKSNSSEIEKVSKKLSTVSKSASNALQTANKALRAADTAQTSADTAQTAASAAQVTADSAKATADSAATEVSKRVTTYKHSTKFVISDALNIDVGESFTLSQNGKWFNYYLRSGDIVSCIFHSVTEIGATSSPVSLFVDSDGGYEVKGIFIFIDYTKPNASSVRVFTVLMLNYTSTSKLILHRIV